jgi:hypothetical protein
MRRLAQGIVATPDLVRVLWLVGGFRRRRCGQFWTCWRRG